MSRTGSGISIYFSALISCSMRFFGKMASNAAGGSGSFVPGCSGGGSGSGKSALRLYQADGMSACVRSKRVFWLMKFLNLSHLPVNFKLKLVVFCQMLNLFWRAEKCFNHGWTRINTDKIIP